MATERDEPQLINIFIKSPKDKKEIAVSESSTIEEVRAEIAKVFDAKADCICMLYAGKILKNGETITQSNIQNGTTVNIVIRTSLPGTGAPPRIVPDLGSRVTQSGGLEQMGLLGMLGGLSGLAGLCATGGLGGMSGFSGMGGANLAEIQNQLMANPEMMSQLVDSPIFHQIMSNPDIMKQIFMANPETRKLMETNPEVMQILNNPEMLKMCMEMVRNPNILKASMMGKQDGGQLQALQSLIGGVVARSSGEAQDPALAASAASADNKSSDEIHGGNSRSSNRGREEPTLDRGEPTLDRGEPTLDREEPTLDRGEPTLDRREPTLDRGEPTLAHTADGVRGRKRNSGGGISDILNSPSMQSILQQMNSHPEMLNSVLQSPSMQSMMENLRVNLEASRETVGSGQVISNEERYHNQLDQLASMGFTDRTQNLQCLIDVNGNVDAAIDRLLVTKLQ